MTERHCPNLPTIVTRTNLERSFRPSLNPLCNIFLLLPWDRVRTTSKQFPYASDIILCAALLARRQDVVSGRDQQGASKAETGYVCYSHEPITSMEYQICSISALTSLASLFDVYSLTHALHTIHSNHTWVATLTTSCIDKLHTQIFTMIGRVKA